MTTNNNKLILVSGHSGSGKTTLMRELMNNELTSFTTRPKRDGEVEGKDYYFITKQEYGIMYANEQLAEHTQYDGNYYGLSKSEIEQKLSSGHAYVVVDYNGMLQLKQLYNNCVTISLHTTKEDMARQMLDRGDTIEAINKRMLKYDKEISNKQYYDYAVVNRYGEFEKTKHILETIIKSETE